MKYITLIPKHVAYMTVDSKLPGMNLYELSTRQRGVYGLSCPEAGHKSEMLIVQCWIAYCIVNVAVGCRVYKEEMGELAADGPKRDVVRERRTVK